MPLGDENPNDSALLLQLLLLLLYIRVALANSYPSGAANAFDVLNRHADQDPHPTLWRLDEAAVATIFTTMPCRDVSSIGGREAAVDIAVFLSETNIYPRYYIRDFALDISITPRRPAPLPTYGATSPIAYQTPRHRSSQQRNPTPHDPCSGSLPHE